LAVPDHVLPSSKTHWILFPLIETVPLVAVTPGPASCSTLRSGETTSMSAPGV
jgi:hypothetical protein